MAKSTESERASHKPLVANVRQASPLKRRAETPAGQE